MIKKVAVAVYKVQNDKPLFFVAKRIEMQDGIWQYVTGHVEKGEEFKVAAIREIREELGDVRILNFIDLKEENNFISISGKKYNEKIFAVEIDNVKVLEKNEFQKYRWCETEEATKLVNWHSHRRTIKKVAQIIKGKKYPKIFIICAPGGAGKDTLISKVLEKYRFSRPKTYTTRALRKDGKEWRIHVSKAKFKEMEADGNFIESNFFGGFWYATPRKFIENALVAGENIIIEIDLNGLRSFKKIYSNVVSFFILTDLKYLRKRLQERGCHDQLYVETRMQIAKKEIANSGICDYIIKNEEGKLDEAVKDLSNKIKEEMN